jgi:hydrogenase maturation factor
VGTKRTFITRIPEKIPMPEATQRPWYASHDGNGYDHIQSAAVNEDNYVARVDSMDVQGNANADLIMRAVNAHDALVAALGHVIHYVETDDALTDRERLIRIVAIASTALEQVK